MPNSIRGQLGVRRGVYATASLFGPMVTQSDMWITYLARTASIARLESRLQRLDERVIRGQSRISGNSGVGLKPEVNQIGNLIPIRAIAPVGVKQADATYF